VERAEQVSQKARILAFLIENEGQPYTSRAVRTELGIKRSSAQGRLLDLFRAGNIARFKSSGPGKRLHYIYGEFFRYSFGLSWFEQGEELSHPIAVHGEYFGALIQAWSGDTELLNREKPALKAILYDEIERWLGYPQSEWWFPTNEGEGLQTVEFDKKLNGTYEWRIEDEQGSAVRTGRGELAKSKR